MEYDKSIAPYFGEISEWAKVIPVPDDDIIFDDDCPPLESGVYFNPVRRFNGRVIPPRQSPLDAFDPELLAFMKSLTPYVQMEDSILGGMPVFRDTTVPIKRMFDHLLAGKHFDDFLLEYPSVPRHTALAVLESEATVFYESISVAMDSVTAR
jgi:uncharacterized protein (DUF433 family)